MKELQQNELDQVAGGYSVKDLLDDASYVGGLIAAASLSAVKGVAGVASATVSIVGAEVNACYNYLTEMEDLNNQANQMLNDITLFNDGWGHGASGTWGSAGASGCW